MVEAGTILCSEAPRMTHYWAVRAMISSMAVMATTC